MADTIQATRMRKGMLIKIGNDLFRVLELQHVTPGNLRGFVRAKFRNIRSGTLADQKLRSEDMVERAILDERQMQYMYSDWRRLLLHGHRDLRADAHHQRGARRLGELSDTRDDDQRRVLRLRTRRHRAAADRRLVVQDTVPAIKGATANAQLKPATLETGLVVQVPPFISPGDKIRVSTETGEYQSRA